MFRVSRLELLSPYTPAQKLQRQTFRSLLVWCFVVNAVRAGACGPNSMPRPSRVKGRPYWETFPSASAQASIVPPEVADTSDPAFRLPRQLFWQPAYTSHL